MTEEDRLDFVIGQVVALKAALMAIASQSERPSELLAAIRRDMEITISTALPTTVSESTLDGFAEVRRAVEFAAEDAAKRRGGGA